NHCIEKKSERHIDIEQNYKTHKNFYRSNKVLFWCMMRKFCNVKEIIGDSTHQLTHFGIVKESIGHSLQVVIQCTAHIRFNISAHDVPHARHIVGSNHFNHFNKNKESCELKNQT